MVHIPKEHYSLEQVVENCIIIADQIIASYEELGSHEINILYIKNGGSLPGEFIGHILAKKGYKINLYDPHYWRYNENGEGEEIRVKKDLTNIQKEQIAASVNNGNLTIILDELADKGDTLKYARDSVMTYKSVEEEMFNNYVFTGVICRKPVFAALPDDSPLKKSLKFCAVPNAPDKWLTFPWEKESIHYDKSIAKIVYKTPERLREFVKTLA